MPADLADAHQRLSDIRLLVLATDRITHHAQQLRRELPQVSTGQLWLSVVQSSSWRVAELLVERTLASGGAASYGLISLIGLAYTYGYYEFDKHINIFVFFDTSDFFLAAFRDLQTLVRAFLCVLVIAVLLTIAYFASTRVDAALFARHRSPLLVRLLTPVLLVFALLAAVYFPYCMGTSATNHAFREQNLVRYTLRPTAGRDQVSEPPTRRSVLLGTTGGYHIFYTCSPGWSPAGTPCTNGAPFVVPTPNLVSMDFHEPLRAPTPPLSTTLRNHCLSFTVGHFEQGKHHLEDPSSIPGTLGRRIAKASSWLEGRVPSQLVLVGRVDVAALADLTVYGSDMGLAQARATWVRDRLLDLANPDAKSSLDDAILLSSGPLHVDDDSECNRRNDRVVEIWSCSTVAAKPAAASPL